MPEAEEDSCIPTDTSSHSDETSKQSFSVTTKDTSCNDTAMKVKNAMATEKIDSGISVDTDVGNTSPSDSGITEKTDLTLSSPTKNIQEGEREPATTLSIENNMKRACIVTAASAESPDFSSTPTDTSNDVPKINDSKNADLVVPNSTTKTDPLLIEADSIATKNTNEITHTTTSSSDEATSESIKPSETNPITKTVIVALKPTTDSDTSLADVSKSTSVDKKTMAMYSDVNTCLSIEKVNVNDSSKNICTLPDDESRISDKKNDFVNSEHKNTVKNIEENEGTELKVHGKNEENCSSSNKVESIQKEQCENVKNVDSPREELSNDASRNKVEMLDVRNEKLNESKQNSNELKTSKLNFNKTVKEIGPDVERTDEIHTKKVEGELVKDDQQTQDNRNENARSINSNDVKVKNKLIELPPSQEQVEVVDGKDIKSNDDKKKIAHIKLSPTKEKKLLHLSPVKDKEKIRNLNEKKNNTKEIVSDEKFKIKFSNEEKIDDKDKTNKRNENRNSGEKMCNKNEVEKTSENYKKKVNKDMNKINEKEINLKKDEKKIIGKDIIEDNHFEFNKEKAEIKKGDNDVPKDQMDEKDSTIVEEYNPKDKGLDYKLKHISNNVDKVHEISFIKESDEIIFQSRADKTKKVSENSQTISQKLKNVILMKPINEIDVKKKKTFSDVNVQKMNKSSDKVEGNGAITNQGNDIKNDPVSIERTNIEEVFQLLEEMENCDEKMTDQQQRPSVPTKTIKELESIVKEHTSGPNKNLRETEVAKESISEQNEYIKQIENISQENILVQNKSKKDLEIDDEKFSLKEHSPVKIKTAKNTENAAKESSSTENRTAKETESIVKDNTPVHNKTTPDIENAAKESSSTENRTAKETENIVKDNTPVQNKTTPHIENAAKESSSIENKTAKETENIVKENTPVRNKITPDIKNAAKESSLIENKTAREMGNTVKDNTPVRNKSTKETENSAKERTKSSVKFTMSTRKKSVNQYKSKYNTVESPARKDDKTNTRKRNISLQKNRDEMETSVIGGDHKKQKLDDAQITRKKQIEVSNPIKAIQIEKSNRVESIEKVELCRNEKDSPSSSIGFRRKSRNSENKERQDTVEKGIENSTPKDESLAKKIKRDVQEKVKLEVKEDKNEEQNMAYCELKTNVAEEVKTNVQHKEESSDVMNVSDTAIKIESVFSLSETKCESSPLPGKSGGGGGGLKRGRDEEFVKRRVRKREEPCLKDYYLYEKPKQVPAVFSAQHDYSADFNGYTSEYYDSTIYMYQSYWSYVQDEYSIGRANPLPEYKTGYYHSGNVYTNSPPQAIGASGHSLTTPAKNTNNLKRSSPVISTIEQTASMKADAKSVTPHLKTINIAVKKAGVPEGASSEKMVSKTVFTPSTPITRSIRKSNDKCISGSDDNTDQTSLDEKEKEDVVKREKTDNVCVITLVPKKDTTSDTTDSDTANISKKVASITKKQTTKAQSPKSETSGKKNSRVAPRKINDIEKKSFNASKSSISQAANIVPLSRKELMRSKKDVYHNRKEIVIPTKKTCDANYKLPLVKYGWKREIVCKTNGNGTLIDVYYYSPSGRKFRSVKEIHLYLTSNSELKPFHFNFTKEKLGLGPPLEITRESIVRTLLSLDGDVPKRTQKSVNNVRRAFFDKGNTAFNGKRKSRLLKKRIPDVSSEEEEDVDGDLSELEDEVEEETSDQSKQGMDEDLVPLNERKWSKAGNSSETLKTNKFEPLKSSNKNSAEINESLSQKRSLGHKSSTIKQTKTPPSKCTTPKQMKTQVRLGQSQESETETEPTNEVNNGKRKNDSPKVDYSNESKKPKLSEISGAGDVPHSSNNTSSSTLDELSISQKSIEVKTECTIRPPINRITINDVSNRFNAFVHLCKYLRVEDLLRVARVNRLFNAAAHTHLLWQNVRLKNSKVYNWEGLAHCLIRHNTHTLDMLKMITSSDPDENDIIWNRFYKIIGKIDSLQRLELGRVTGAEILNTASNCNKNLKEFSAIALKMATIDLKLFESLSNLSSLQLRSFESKREHGLIMMNIPLLVNMKHLRHLSLTGVKNLKSYQTNVFKNFPPLESLEIGDCVKIDEKFPENSLQDLKSLKRLRLENVQGSVANKFIETIITLDNLRTLELINIDTKKGFDELFSQLKQIENLLIFPTYITQSSTTNWLILNGLYSLKANLKSLTWGVTQELLRVTNLFIHQWNSQKNFDENISKEQLLKKNFNSLNCIPVMKPLPKIYQDTVLEDGEGAAGKSSSICELDIICIDKLKVTLEQVLSSTQIKLLTIPVSSTTRVYLPN